MRRKIARLQPDRWGTHTLTRSSWQRVLVAAVVVGAQLIPVRSAVAVDGTVLPDIGMLAPKDFSIQTRPRGVRLLRFDSVVVNVGPGLFDVEGQPPSGSGDRPVLQNLQLSTGGWTQRETPAGMFYAGDGHDHWHVRDLQEWTIAFYNGGKAGEPLSWGAKTGFCFWDNFPYPGSAAKLYSGTTSCHERTDGTIPMGLTVGWGDEYPSTIAGQYIDITGLPNGTYIVSLTADQRGDFLEANEENNDSGAIIEITRKSVRVLQAWTELPAP